MPAPTVEPVFTPPTCDAAGSFVASASTEALDYSTVTENGVITISVVAKPGFVVSGDPGPWTKALSELAQLTGDDCDETQPPDDTEVDAAGPVPPPAQAVRTAGTPTQASAPVDPAPASLPATGSSSWVLVGAALAALASGLFLTRLSRRPDEQIV